MPINRYFKLYLNAGRSIPLVINANQNDKDEQWYFSLFTETGEQYFPDAGAIVGIKCDGKLIDNEATVDSRGYVIVTETAQMTAVPGKNLFELQLNEHTHGTANFIVLVEPSPTNGGVLSDSDLSLFQQAINSIAIAGSGAPAVATLASEMIDTGKIYLYAGTETGYTAGHWYYYKGSAWVDGGKYGGTVDSTLTVQGAAADAKKTGDEISELKSQIDQKTGLSEEVKVALLDCFENIGGLYLNGNARTYIENLRSALYPPVDLSSISAVYTQSDDVYATTPLDDLKADLVVTAHYSDGTSGTVTNYLLSGTLAEGTSTVTVTYGGKTTTFSVTVIAVQLPYNLNFKFNDIVLSDGYIGDDGSVVQLESNKYYDELIPAVGFWLVSSIGGVYKLNTDHLYYRLAEYDSSKEFLARKALSRNAPIIADATGTTFVKMGFNYSNNVFTNADRFVACNILDTSICTILQSTIDANGDVQTSADSSISDFLPVNEGFIILRYTEGTDSALVVLYDENKQLISRGACTVKNTDYVFEATSQAKYVRFRCPTNPAGTLYVSYVK